MRRLGVIMRGDAHNPHEALGVLNPATTRAPDGKLYIFPRVVAAGNYSRVGIAEVIFDAADNPTGVERRGYALEPTESYEQNARTAGCEDPRITYIEPLRRYVMTYTAYGPLGPRIALAESTDLLYWRRLGPVKFAFDPVLRVDFDGSSRVAVGDPRYSGISPWG
jgi:beta-1,2-mannobiose phosphorylase / 1,2-beta-oligomannan phosphorylase